MNDDIEKEVEEILGEKNHAETPVKATLKVVKVSKHKASKKNFKHEKNLSYGEKKHADFLKSKGN